MNDYDSGQGFASIRNSSQEHPAQCPWCGNQTWFPSDGDEPRDNGRIQMYCDTPLCVSRETELIIIRGEGASDRADVRALHALDEGHVDGDTPEPTTMTLGELLDEDRAEAERRRRLARRTNEEPLTLRVR